MGRRPAPFAVVLVFLASALSVSTAPRRTQADAPAIPDREFWNLLTGLSEPGGVFAQQLMSNEDSVEFVIPRLKAAVRPGGVYIGVGSEQNFTYLAALQPRLAFIVDIRRENLLEMLMYKALFELAADRADFVSRLFARRRPDGFGASSDVAALFAAYANVQTDAKWFDQNVADVLDTLTRVRQFPLSPAEKATIAGMLGVFRAAGPDTLKGWGDRTNPTFARLMSAGDLEGRHQGFLSSEENYRVVRELHRRNLIVPIIGDFAGEKAIQGIARYLSDRHAVLDVFYVSNVERYLFEQGDHGRQFYANLARMPLAPSGLFIRSVTRAISARLEISVPPGPTKWWTFLAPIQDCLDRISDGRLRTYRDLFAGS